MKTVTIYRDDWDRGGGANNHGHLFDEHRAAMHDRCACALGFLCNQLFDIRWQDMDGMIEPNDFVHYLEPDDDRLDRIINSGLFDVRFRERPGPGEHLPADQESANFINALWMSEPLNTIVKANDAEVLVRLSDGSVIIEASEADFDLSPAERAQAVDLPADTVCEAVIIEAGRAIGIEFTFVDGRDPSIPRG